MLGWLLICFLSMSLLNGKRKQARGFLVCVCVWVWVWDVSPL